MNNSFKEYCKKDFEKCTDSFGKFNSMQNVIRKKLLKYVEKNGYDLSQEDLNFLDEWNLLHEYEVMKINHEYDEEFKKTHEYTEVTDEEMELMFPSYIFGEDK